MTTLPYWHVDAFAARPFTGNQAAVIELESWLPDETLLAIAAENMFADTAFLLRDASGEADWELRWFSPATEVALCGHATLASGHVLLGREQLDRVTFRTRRSGILELRRSESGSGYELALPAIGLAPGDWPEAAALLGAEPRQTRTGSEGYAVFLLESEAALRALRPDFAGLAALGNGQFICTAPGTATDIVSRVFVPGAGVNEDSVTGSAHAALAPLWAAMLGRETFTAHQASQRGGDLQCRVDGARAWIGGDCVTVVEGSFFLP